MKHVVFAIAVLLSQSFAVATSTVLESRDVQPEYVAHDSKTAALAAVEYFRAREGELAKTARRFRAASVVFARAPVALGTTLKKGEPIWVVVVVNDAQSSILQIPIGIVWVRAQDGTVFITEPKNG